MKTLIALINSKKFAAVVWYVACLEAGGIGVGTWGGGGEGKGVVLLLHMKIFALTCSALKTN